MCDGRASVALQGLRNVCCVWKEGRGRQGNECYEPAGECTNGNVSESDKIKNRHVCVCVLSRSALDMCSSSLTPYTRYCEKKRRNTLQKRTASAIATQSLIAEEPLPHMEHERGENIFGTDAVRKSRERQIRSKKRRPLEGVVVQKDTYTNVWEE